MSAVGIVTIALGVLGVCEGGGPLVAPEAYFGRLKETIASNARIRMLGAFVMAIVWPRCALVGGPASWTQPRGLLHPRKDRSKGLDRDSVG